MINPKDIKIIQESKDLYRLSYLDLSIILGHSYHKFDWTNCNYRYFKCFDNSISNFIPVADGIINETTGEISRIHKINLHVSLLKLIRIVGYIINSSCRQIKNRKNNEKRVNNINQQIQALQDKRQRLMNDY